MGEMRQNQRIYDDKAHCCGCAACVNICPKQAVHMQEDECGFIYPEIDETKCIFCGLCKKVCSFQSGEGGQVPIAYYAAICNDKELVKKSASAGVFAVLASDILKQGGMVFGASFDEEWNVRHISVKSSSDLEKLQGSKYAQSSVGLTYSDAKKALEDKKTVLFSGTPCQIAGLNGFLDKKYDNLLTVDIVCHGVPSNKMLKEYLKIIEYKNKGSIDKFTFRDKSIGWGINGSAIIRGKKIKLWQSASSYLHYFSKGWIYRDSCYKCKYACLKRTSDITIGDYWGIEKEHPDIIGKWNEDEAVSLIIINSSKGKKAISEIKLLQLEPSNYDKMKRRNKQLECPTDIGQRDILVNIFIREGWNGIEKEFENNVGIKKYYSQIKAMIPVYIRRKLKYLKEP